MQATGTNLEQVIEQYNRARDASRRSLVDLWISRRPIREWLETVARDADPNERPDFYGEREVVANFEHEVATLLDKPAAVFMPSGTMAQQIALRIWADRRGIRRVAFHPTCHLELYEQKAYAALHQLDGLLIGSAQQLITLETLQAIPGPIAALLLELPQREIGGQLPSWEELQAQVAWARERDIRLHLDGARLWEAAPAMNHSLAEIGGLFDSIYVSMYKGLGGIAGAVLAGPADFIAEARLWQQRHGGRLVRLFPLVVAARAALRERLPRFPLYRQRALQVARALREVPRLRIVPDPPHAHMMHIYLPGTRETLLRRATMIVEREGVVLFRYLQDAEVPGYSRAELEISEDALSVTDAEVTSLFRKLVDNRS